MNHTAQSIGQKAGPHDYDPNRLLDALRARLGIDSDKALSRKLQMAMQIVRDIRAGVMPLRASMLVWMAESTGASIDELRRILGKRRAKARMGVAIGAAR